MDSFEQVRLRRLAMALVDQQQAQVLVPPHQASSGFWFGGGNVVRLADGTFLMVGRHRHSGDSRLGLAAGERGCELTLLQASRPLGPYEPIQRWGKDGVQSGHVEVLSIEGACLYASERGLELFLSSEKAIPYPDHLLDYQKAGTGIWSIDALAGRDLTALRRARPQPLLTADEPAALHCKDPVVFTAPGGDTAMIYCHHPFSWTSSDSGLALREGGESWFYPATDAILPRGMVWDVAVTRITDYLPVPRLGCFADLPELALYFYDGAECVRQLAENPQAVRRPRGFSCEELGGLACGYAESFPELERISMEGPLFVSPHGTGCSRYVSTLVTPAGILATWQQSQPDQSQPLVGHFLPMEQVDRLLRA
jgi:hypothetical protein